MSEVGSRPRSRKLRDATSAEEGGPDERSGPMEGLLQDLIRRAATVGLAGFFLTEEAIRKAFSDVVPQEWGRFVVRQSQEARRELIDRMAQEFGSWLKAADPRTLARLVLENFSFSIRIDITARPRPAEEPEPRDRRH